MNCGQTISLAFSLADCAGKSTAAVRIWVISMASASIPPGMTPPRVTMIMAVNSRLNCGIRWSMRRSTSSHEITSRRGCCGAVPGMQSLLYENYKPCTRQTVRGFSITNFPIQRPAGPALPPAWVAPPSGRLRHCGPTGTGRCDRQ